MAFFTKEDSNDFKLLADNQKVVQRRNLLLSRAPHIGSRTVLRVQKCAGEYEYRDPVYIPPVDDGQHDARLDLEDLAIVAEWRFTQDGCDHTVSCNPFYPKSKRCKGLKNLAKDKATDTESEEHPDGAFSFRTLNGQVFDVCQPVCYDGSVGRDNMVGVTSRYRFGKCRVYDPLMLAFYLDPTLRYVNPDTQILERKAFFVRDVSVEPYKDAALLASIPTDYCDQYAAEYTADGRVQGIDMYKCGDNVLTWSTSWLLGESLPKLASIGYDKVSPYVTSGHDWAREEEVRYPPTRDFLKSRELWLSSGDSSKRRLPFPLRLSDLGIRRGTDTEWLVWTDEFSSLSDGRNDMYGGRLVERSGPVPTGVPDRTTSAAFAAATRNLSAGGRFAYTDPSTGERHERTKRNTDQQRETDDVRLKSAMLKELLHGAAEYQNILNEDLDRSHVGLLGMGAGLAYGAGYAYLSEKASLPSSLGVLKSAFSAIGRAPAYARKASLKMVGYWAAKGAVVHSVESVVTRSIVSRVKTLAFAQVLGPLALVIDTIALAGLAVDIIFVFLNAVGVSTPTSRRENFVSDRRLYRLAQTEIEFNYRLYGVGNIELTPFQFVVNTPYLTPDEDVQAYMALMPIVYAAREMNSHGGHLKPDAETDRSEVEVDEDGSVHYVKNGVRLAQINEGDDLLTGAERVVCSVTLPPQDRGRGTEARPTKTAAEGGLAAHYIVVLFIATLLIGHFYPTKHWTIAVALLISLLSFLELRTPPHE